VLFCVSCGGKGHDRKHRDLASPRPLISHESSVDGGYSMSDGCIVWGKRSDVETLHKSPPCATFIKASDFLTAKLDDHEVRLKRSVWRERLATRYEVTRAIDPSDPCAPPAGFVFSQTGSGIMVYPPAGARPGSRMPNGLRSCTYWNARTNAKQIERYPATANDAPGRWDGCEDARDWAAWALGEA
jgi:hypothetical protein